MLLLCLSLFTNCKEETKQETTVANENPYGKTAKQSDGLTLLGGEFSYYADAAVLQIGSSSIYGVVLNDKMKELYTMGKPYRTEPTDGIQVQIRGKIIPKEEGKEGWPNSIEIKEIISVKALTNKNEVIKIGK